jgi:acetyl-CoA carboxylase carboxyl transferase subunit beta
MALVAFCTRKRPLSGDTMAFFSKPSYSTITYQKKKDIPKGLWTKCPKTGEIIYFKDLEQNLMVVPNSGYHFPIAPRARIQSLVDEGSFTEKDANLRPTDPLEFSANDAPYLKKLSENQAKTREFDAIVCGEATLGGHPLQIAVMDFRFLGGSLGSVVGEKITRSIERAVERKHALIIVSASGGARMHEGIFSLMQMAKTSAALARLDRLGLPFFSILTNPTTGGVTASFATLGDLIIAEPGALIGFAGPRVIKETLNQDLPEGFQTSEFLLEAGLVDQIIPRTQMRERLTYFLDAYQPAKAV